MRKSCHQSGSALLATILLTATIGLIGVGIARISLVDLRVASSFEDSAIAYAAAEAGIEEGLLRVRFDRNTEIPVANMREETNQAELINLSSGVTLGSPVQRGVGPFTPSEQLYELRVWYKESQIGSSSSSDLQNPSYPYRLYKDQTLELNVSNLRGQNLTFAYQAPAGVAARIETRIVRDNCGSTGVFCETNKQFTDPSIGQTGITISVPSGPADGVYRLRIKPFLFVLGTQIPAAPSSYIAYHLRPQVSDNLVDAGITYIESTGYYGVARRTLIAKVERRTGTVLGVYDYALFSADIAPVP
jgi:hypothetical protein